MAGARDAAPTTPESAARSLGKLGIEFRSVQGLTASAGRAMFLAGVFLMLTGDWPRSTLLPTRWAVPLTALAWQWLYLMLLATSLVLLLWGGVLRVGRSTTADFLHAPIALLIAAFLPSVAFSQMPSLSQWALGCLLAVVGFTLAVAAIVEDTACMRGMSVAIAAAALLLALRVILWRVDEGLTAPASHVPNNAWLGRIQISWVLNLLAPLLLAGCLGARARGRAILYGVAWLVSGAAIYMVFSKTGVATFPLTTLTLCALTPRSWRRWLPLLAGIVGLAVAHIAVSPTMLTAAIDTFQRTQLDPAVAGRGSILRQTIRMIADHPLVGIGFGTYDHVAQLQYGPIADSQFFGKGWHAHNTTLHLLAETGIFGALAWCYLWFTVVCFLLRRWRNADALGRLNSSAVLCVLLGFIALSMTEAMTAARLHASLRMNLTLGLLVTYGIRLAVGTPSAPIRDVPAR